MSLSPSTSTLSGSRASLLVGLVRRPIEALSFWTAVALPVLYVLILTGVVTGVSPASFAALIGLNALALVVGHGHRRD
ncbi:hypothetical protein [Natronomonas sp. EA1]|uniref:hypothetical protein n=1 Tax=Natronomonas sp. EA1 TaxID=3421655 RepID=UPI003EBF4A3A